MSVLEPPRRRPGSGILLPALLTLAGLAVLVGLGWWQLERRDWKEALIAQVRDRLALPPMPLAPPGTWSRLDRSDAEFRRVTFPAEFLHEQEALVYGSGSAFRPDVSGPGYWVFTPARLLGGSLVVVNRGFVPEARRDPASRAEGQATGVVDIAGTLRWPEARGRFTPADDPSRNLWFVRDHAAIAQAKGWDAPAPFYVEQEAPVPPGGLPKPGRVHPDLPNSHLQYALTWFGLSLCLLGVFLVWTWQRLRRRPA